MELSGGILQLAAPGHNQASCITMHQAYPSHMVGILAVTKVHEHILQCATAMLYEDCVNDNLPP